MSIKKVVVAGGGVLGSQIAFQAAFKGFDVTIWLRSDASIGRSQPKIDRLHNIYLAEFKDIKTKLGTKGAAFPRGLIDDPEHISAEKSPNSKQKPKRRIKTSNSQPTLSPRPRMPTSSSKAWPKILKRKKNFTTPFRPSLKTKPSSRQTRLRWYRVCSAITSKIRNAIWPSTLQTTSGATT